MLRRNLPLKRKKNDTDSPKRRTKQAQQGDILYNNKNIKIELENDDDRRVAYNYNNKNIKIELENDDYRRVAKLELEQAVLGTADVVLASLQQKLEPTEPEKEKEKKKKQVLLKKWEDSDDEEDRGNEFEVVNPSWAENFYEDNSDDSDEEALKTYSHNVLTSSTSLPSSSLSFKRVADVNKEDPAKSTVSSVQFHPKATVLLAGSQDNSLRLFAVDGSKNRKIHSLFLEKFSVKGAKFSRGGSEIIIGSNHKNFYIFDMETNGLTFRPKLKGLEASKMSNFEISPDGRFIAFTGQGGYVHLFSQQSKLLIESLKANGAVYSVKFSQDGQNLYTFGDEGQVHIWNLNTRDCIHHFSDDGCINGRSIAVSPDGKYIALGSESGIVNLYDHEAAMATRHPKPIKHIKNLTNACKEALFNPQSEILALRSPLQPSGIRLVHFPSQTVLPNFPNHFDRDLETLTSMDFSPNSGYLAVGNKKGKCLLFRLEHYKRY